jgi:glycosyltransferase involved in cell wall biosynthesis
LKILFLLPEYYPHSGGGISTYYMHYIKDLQPYCEKIKVIVGSGYTQANDVFEHEGITVEYLKPEIQLYYLNKFTQYDLLPEFKRNIAAAWGMWKQANEGDDYDIIECTDFALGFIPWLIHHNKPVITRLHGSMGQISLQEDELSADVADAFIQQAELLLLPACDQLISHSKANQIFWNEVIKPNKVVHINPVYNNFSQPLPLSQRDNYGLVTARIQKWKGPVELCEAYRLLTTPKPFIKWIGYDKIYHQQQTTGNYLKNNFPNVWGKHVIPQQPLANTQIPALQQKVKFGLIPSTWDMFNFTCVEFMSAGTPVICSEGAGASELIEHGVNGFKYPANDVAALAECINALCRLDDKEYMKMANSATETVKNILSASSIIPANLKLYESVLANFKPQPSNAYLDALYQPSNHQYDISSILDKQPLKKLTAYYIKRIQQKLFSKK